MVEGIRCLGNALYPILPQTSLKILAMLNISDKPTWSLAQPKNKEQITINKPIALFPRIEQPALKSKSETSPPKNKNKQ